MPLADTLLRMAEYPALYAPLWSAEIMGEVSRSMLQKFGKSSEQATRRVRVMNASFPDASISGYGALTAAMPNHAKDRHVLAAAVHAKADFIITLNLKDFPATLLAPFGVQPIGPSEFLIACQQTQPDLVEAKMRFQAENVGLTWNDFVRRLELNAPAFVRHLRDTL